ncbi:restriction endonuclease subunit S [Vibrio breoganii]
MKSNTWRETTLGELADFINGDRGKNYPGVADRVDVGIPFINTGHILPSGRLTQDDMDYITSEKYNQLGSGKVRPGDIVYCLRGSTIGKTARNHYEEGAIASSLVIVRAKPEVNQDYLYYFLTSPAGQQLAKSNDNGSAQPNLSAKTLSKYPLLVPNVEEQESIVNTLNAIDNKIEVNTKLNQTLEQMAQATFKSWFVDFDPVKAKMNGEQPEGMDAATASLFPEKLVESELGLIPEGWEASKLENLVDIASSKRVFAKEYLEEGVPFYRGKEITELSKGNSVTPEIYISEERYQELKDKAGAPKEGDILITSVGTIGNTYLVDSDDKFYFKDGNLTWVKDYKGEEIPYFLMEWFKSAVGKCAIENIKIGSTQQAITIKSLNGIKLVNPSNDVHKNFTKLIEPLYRKHRANIKQSKALANLRDTLLPKLLSGEIELETATENK